MEFSVKSGHAEKQRSACLIVGVFTSERLSPSAETIDKASKGYLRQWLKQGDCEGKLGQLLLLHQVPGIQAERVLLVGAGSQLTLGEKQYREIIAKVISFLSDLNITDMSSFLSELSVKERDLAWKVRLTIQHYHQVSYRFNELKSKKESIKKALRHFVFMLTSRREFNLAEKAIQQGMAITQGMQTCKNLANLPANICNPTFLAEKAKQFAKAHEKVSVAILEEKEMAALKMGALLSVTQGSHTPAKFITIEYRGERKSQPIVLIGKGITFDTGGNSLKSPQSMIGMKYDMCGAATVFGVLEAAVLLELPLNIIGVIPACENMPGRHATRPEDIVTSMSGTTIEILNTDAEGRLILADALTYCERFDPDVVIDIATLTGASFVALGQQACALMSNDPRLAKALYDASIKSSDRTWELPLWEEYHEALRSEFADIANISLSDVGAGTIVGGSFLSHFAKKCRWAHLDIASVAFSATGPKRGATGRPIPLLVQYLLDRI